MLKELIGRLGCIVVVGGSKAKRRRGNPVVEFVNAPARFEEFDVVDPGQGQGSAADSLLQPAKKTGFVDPILTAGHFSDGGGKVDRSGDGDDTVEQAVAFVPQLASKFQCHVAPETVADQECGPAMFAADITKESECIRRQTRMIHGFAKRLRTAATSHVCPVDGITVFQR